MGIAIDLSGRRLLVMGGSSGVGRAVGLRASQAGARVAFAARRLDRLEKTVAEANGEAMAIGCDVRDPAACRDAVSSAAGAFGGLDALLYATGMSPLAMLPDATQDAWREVMDVNLIGASLVTAAALPHLQESGGRALYISSYSVRQCLPGLALYRVSKVALDALVEGFRMEQPDVEFTRVIVGNTAGTEFAQGWGAEQTRAALQVWVERNLFPSPTMMPLDTLAEAIVSVLAVRGYVDDIAVMPRPRDAAARADVDPE